MTSNDILGALEGAIEKLGVNLGPVYGAARSAASRSRSR